MDNVIGQHLWVVHLSHCSVGLLITTPTNNVSHAASKAKKALARLKKAEPLVYRVSAIKGLTFQGIIDA